MRKSVKMTVLLFLVSTLIGACTRNSTPITSDSAPRHFKALKAIETLLETQPEVALDSVMALKERAEMLPFTPLDFNELQLREVQAQYKNRVLSEASPDLKPVIVFYDSLVKCYPADNDLQYLLANAYYYKGVESAFANEDVESFSYYLQALGVMELRNQWDDNPYANRFIALIHTRLSEILYRYGLNDAALENCRKAFSFYSSDADRAAMIRYEAAIHQSEKDYDKALARFQEAEKWVAVGDGPIQLSIGAKLFEIQQYDSAFVHLESAFLNGDRFARVDAAAKLAEICRIKGWDDLELRYTRFYVESSLGEPRMASRKMEIEYLYDDFNNPKIETTVPQDNSNRLSLGLMLLLLVVIALLAFVIVRNRKRISHIENKISTIEKKRVQDDTQEVGQVSQPLVDKPKMPKNVVKVDFEASWNAFVNSPIALKISHSMEGKDIMIKSVGVYPKLKLKEMDYIELVQEINREFPDFSVWFLKKHPDLNVSDLRHGCLALLGFNDAEIAVLEGISYSGTNRRSNKILAVLKSDDSLENAMINSLKEFCN